MASTDAQTRFDLGIWYIISSWPALAIAVQNNWGGPESSSKRDWFAGAISDLWSDRPDTDQIDVETVLLQVMQDEFDVNVEDETEVPVAEEIMKIRKEVFEDNDFSGVESAKQKWTARGGKIPKNVNVVEHTFGEDGKEIENSSSDDDDDDEDEDVEMGDAPPPAPKEKAEPEVDEDGFTKVVGKKRK